MKSFLASLDLSLCVSVCVFYLLFPSGKEAIKRACKGETYFEGDWVYPLSITFKSNDQFDFLLPVEADTWVQEGGCCSMPRKGGWFKCPSILL